MTRQINGCPGRISVFLDNSLIINDLLAISGWLDQGCCGRYMRHEFQLNELNEL